MPFMMVRDLISKLGGPTAVATKLGLTPSAVTNWDARGEIPPGHRLPIWRMAVEAGVDWRPEDAGEFTLVRDVGDVAA